MKQLPYTPFQEDWWLEATAPGRWDAVEIEKGGQVQARLPFVVTERSGFRILGQPSLTQSLGPWVLDTGAGYTKALSREMSLYKELIQKLPPHDVFKQHFAPQVTNWLPFYWEGFSQTTRYSQVLDLHRDLDSLLAGMDKRDRRQLRDASRHLVAGDHGDIETFLNLNRRTFERQGMELPYTYDYVLRLDEAICKNARRWIVLAHDPDDGKPHAGIYMFKYGERVYSLMSGAEPTLRDQNGGVVARWEAIQLAKSSGAKLLDFQGSMLKTVERRNRNYGAHQLPYFSVSRSNGRLEAYDARKRRRKAPLLAAWRLKERALRPFR